MNDYDLQASGEQQEFSTGAVRDRQTGKGRFDLLPPAAINRLAKHFEKGAAKYGDRNWERGIPLSRYFDSALRHAFSYLQGRSDEDHLVAACWNFLAALETEHRAANGQMSAELLDIGPNRKSMERQRMIYLASPYSSLDPEVRQQRFHEACRATAALLRQGQSVYSPIAYTHPLAEHGLPSDWSFWEKYDREYLAQCDEVVVLTLDGWETSVGVQEEIRIARELDKPVRYLAPELADVSPTLAHVASTSPKADQTPLLANDTPTLAPVASGTVG